MVGEDGEMTMMSGDLWCHVVDLVSVNFTVLVTILPGHKDGQYLQSIGSTNNMHYNRSTAICSRSGCKGMEEKENASYFSLQGTETRCDSDIKNRRWTRN